MKIRLFALAKEFGLDSKDLIQHCTDAGLDVKSSPLASISPEERDLLLAHLKKVLPQPGNVAPAAPETSTPLREEMRREAQSREIRDLGPLSTQLRTRRPPRKETAQSPDESSPVEVAFEEPAPVVIEAEPPVIEAPEFAPVIEPEPQAPAAPVVVAEEPPAAPKPAPVVTPPKPAAPVPPPAAPVAAPPAMEPRSRPAAMTRSDYIAPGGGGSQMREMRPHGSVRSAPGAAPPAASASASAAPAQDNPMARRAVRRAPTGPALAKPSFKPPVIKKSDEPVQKPDLALTRDVLSNRTKLSDILNKNRTDTKRGPTIEEEEAASKSKNPRGLSLEEAREIRRKRRQKTRGPGDDEDTALQRANKRQRRQNLSNNRKTEASIESPITIRSLSEAMGRPARDLITVLFQKGQMVNINDSLTDEEALEIALELGVDLQIEHEADFEDTLAARLERTDADLGGDLQPRPPIITVLGHVDHGKTTLVDRIRSSNVAAGEAGGITQHIAAYQVEHNGQKLTFVDTPGHAAFGEMRARGANVTDIIVLVVAADDGVMPQTVECIAHAKAANVPIVVAMNKIDLPGINEIKVLTELAQHGIQAVEWGGEVEVVRVSGLKGTGVDNLLETLLLTAELNQISAPVDVPAEGVCLEAFRDEGRGPLAWAIIRRGTLKKGDLVLCGPAFGRVRAMYNDKNVEIDVAGPSTPLKIAGLDEVPGAGDRLFGMDDIEEARTMAMERRLRGRTAQLAGRGGPKSLEEFFATRDGALKELPLIIKADTPGSLEAIKGELEKFEHPEVRIKILHMGVGGVNESDVYLAASAGAIIIAFHVIAEDRAEALAAQEGTEIRRYQIIYNVTDDIRQALEGLLEPEKFEVTTGRALVLRTFAISRTGTIAGCRVLNGTIDRNHRIHVIRDQTILNDYGIASLKREKDDVREVREGFECGIRLDGFNDIKEGDLLQAYKIEERRRSLTE